MLMENFFLFYWVFTLYYDVDPLESAMEQI